MPNPEWIAALCRAERLPQDYGDVVVQYVEPLAEYIRDLHDSLQRPVVIGINGAQGSGKSTLALFLASWLHRELHITTARLLLDDLYLTKADRSSLSRSSHRLFVTRGVPGTHDVELGMRTLDALTDATAQHSVPMPAFDKAADDRVPESHWQRIEAPVDVVLFEGWCVGAMPQSDDELALPVNDLEVADDADGRWRREVNRQLQSDYAPLFNRLDALIMLRIPGFEKVFEWRRLQEQKLRSNSASNSPENGTGRGQTDAELRRFIQHYERLTRHMLRNMPDIADIVIDLDAEHRLAGLAVRSRDRCPN